MDIIESSEQVEVYMISCFHCFNCGNRLVEVGSGFLRCTNCESIFLPFNDSDGKQNLQCCVQQELNINLG